jgi:hypothetical protein
LRNETSMSQLIMPELRIFWYKSSLRHRPKSV